MEIRSVSVVIPTNRGGPYLTDAVASLRSQIVRPFEVILVDDGSPPPGLSEVALGLGLTYMRKEAGGISSARNAGVAMSTGEWVAFLDDDDVWHPDRLRAQLAALACAPDAIACFTGGEYIDSWGRRFGTPWGAPDVPADDMFTERTPPPRITTLLIRRDAYLAVGGCRARMEPAEDNDLIARLLLEGEFTAVDRALVSYRRHSANLTLRGLAGRRASKRSLRDLQRVAKRTGDTRRLTLLREKWKNYQVNAASENVGELVTAVRTRDLGYGVRVAAWGFLTLPIASMHAIRRRYRNRLKGQARRAR